MAKSIAQDPVEVVETIGLIPHPSDPTHPPIEPYISDVLPDLLDKHPWLGLILAVFDSDSGLGDHPAPPSIHVFHDEETGLTSLPRSADPIRSHRDAERWLEGYWRHPRNDFNINRLAPQMVLAIGDQHYLVVTVQLDRTEMGHLIHSDQWSADLGGMDKDSLEFQILVAVAKNYV